MKFYMHSPKYKKGRDWLKQGKTIRITDNRTGEIREISTDTQQISFLLNFYRGIWKKIHTEYSDWLESQIIEFGLTDAHRGTQEKFLSNIEVELVKEREEQNGEG